MNFCLSVLLIIPWTLLLQHHLKLHQKPHLLLEVREPLSLIGYFSEFSCSPFCLENEIWLFSLINMIRTIFEVMDAFTYARTRVLLLISYSICVLRIHLNSFLPHTFWNWCILGNFNFMLSSSRTYVSSAATTTLYIMIYHLNSNHFSYFISKTGKPFFKD